MRRGMCKVVLRFSAHEHRSAKTFTYHPLQPSRAQAHDYFRWRSSRDSESSTQQLPAEVKPDEGTDHRDEAACGFERDAQDESKERNRCLALYSDLRLMAEAAAFVHLEETRLLGVCLLRLGDVVAVC